MLAELVEDHQIIIVNDGRNDRTQKIAEELAARHKTGELGNHHRTNKGYGAALRTGFKSATGDLVFYTDSDKGFDFSFDEHIQYKKWVLKVKARHERREYY